MITKQSDIKHENVQIDATGIVLGRLATRIANLLVGKQKPYFTRHLDCGDSVVVTNASKVKITGKKELTKNYTSYSGYPGGLKTKSLKTLRQEKPEKVVHNAVLGMLPKNKLQKIWITRLEIHA